MRSFFPPNGHRRASLLVLALSMCSAGVFASAPAHADTAADSLVVAKSGARHFGAKRFLQAARQFERAYRINPADARNLRYAGRAWQEVGHWDRALNLLERYAQLENNPTLRQSIQPRIQTLRKTTARQRGERLALATVKYPQGKLEIDAARALEYLGEETDLKRAMKLYENARLWAIEAALRVQVDGSIDRLKGKLLALRRSSSPARSGGTGATVKPVAQPNPLAKPPATALAPTSGTLRVVLYVVGGVALVAGVGVGTFGYLQGKDARKNYLADETLPRAESTYKGDYSAYESDVSAAKSLNIAGIAVAGVGAGLVVWAVIRGAAAPSSAAWWLSPRLSGRGAGLAAGLHF